MIRVYDHVSDQEVSFNHALEVHRPYGVLDSILEWVRDNSTGVWGWQLVRASSSQEDGRYIFFFDDEQDYLAFTLRWMDGD